MVLKLITEGHKYFTKLYIEVADQTFDLVNRIMGIKVFPNRIHPFLLIFKRDAILAEFFIYATKISKIKSRN